MNILCLNVGSSSLKFAIYQNRKLICLLQGEVHEIGSKTSYLSLNGKKEKSQTVKDHKEAFFLICRHLPSLSFQAVSYRIVHGADFFDRPTLINKKVLEKISSLIPLAPLHLPNELQVIKLSMDTFKKTQHIGCFDTSFHKTIPSLASRLPLPDSYYKRKIKRYGFHGLSYEYIVNHFPKASKKKIIIAHLGSGTSLCAVKNKKSQDTSMGFNPNSGVMMGTRSGDIESGVILHLLQKVKMTPFQIQSLLENKSGLLGVSNLSSDMSILLNNRSKKKAQLAISMYCYQLSKTIASYLATLNGLDDLIFTGGIGENGPEIRQKVCKALSFFKIQIDTQKNKANKEIISKSTSSIQVHVIKTNEELMLAKHALSILA
ncbi:MAG: acetate/propionate family kinase [Chlamydiota bacterium]|jgi:acetate kinase